MAKGKIKSASVLFVCWIGLMAVVCVPSFIAGICCTESGEPTAPLNASVIRLESDFISLSNAADLSAAPDRAEQPGRRQTAEVLDRGSAVKGNRLDASFDTRQETLE